METEIGLIRNRTDKDCARYVDALKSICDKADLFPAELEKSEKAFSTLGRLTKSCANGSQRIKEIVLGLRTFSRLDEADRKSINLHEGIDSTLMLIEHHFKERVTVEKNYGDLPPVECLAGQLNQVFMNLLSNAADAIEGEGTITITTQAQSDSVSVSFADTGSGIRDDIKAQIFESFFTTKDVGKGTGLGLSISYGIVQKHGGNMEVESAPGKGTTFTITLPIQIPEHIE